MSKLLQALKVTKTENGCVAYETSSNRVLDLFAVIGNMRRTSENDIINAFAKAYAENADLAMKCEFHCRDIRKGLGERRTFRIILKWLANNHPESVVKNLSFIPEYGRWDDLFELLDTPVVDQVVKVCFDQLMVDVDERNEVSLMAKWMPSLNTSSSETKRKAKILCHKLGLSYKSYRKLLVSLRKKIKIVENNLRTKDYTFDYDKLPSKALLKYRSAFFRNDEERYTNFLNSVEKGTAEMHTGTLAPYDIVGKIIAKTDMWRNNCHMDPQERRALDVTWDALEDYTGCENALVVLDGSGSMYGGGTPTPAAVAQSLAIYYAEHNTGMFRNHFITFGARPKLVEIQGDDIVAKVLNNIRYDDCSNTNIAAVFDLLLTRAVVNSVPAREMPEKLYIVSDMQFDCMTSHADLTAFEYAKKKYAEAGYRLPQIVFWNVDCRGNMQVPVTKNEQGCALVSGFSSQIFNMLKEDILDPEQYMLKVLNQERYARISA